MKKGTKGKGQEKIVYKRTVDKAQIPTCNILGVNIAAINMEWLVEYLDKNLSDIKGDYICVSNVHTTVTSYEDASYCAVQNGGLMRIIKDKHIFIIKILQDILEYLVLDLAC